MQLPGSYTELTSVSSFVQAIVSGECHVSASPTQPSPSRCRHAGSPVGAGSAHEIGKADTHPAAETADQSHTAGSCRHSGDNPPHDPPDWCPRPRDDRDHAAAPAAYGSDPCRC